MNKATEAVEKFQSGYACSQAIVSTYASQYGMNENEALKISSGFAAGMRMSETCGAVTGAYMIIGLHAAGEHSENVDDRAEVYSLIKDFSKEFKQRNGCLSCSELLGCDISTSEGLEEAKDMLLFKKKCPAYVKDSSEILDKVLKLNHPSE